MYLNSIANVLIRQQGYYYINFIGRNSFASRGWETCSRLQSSGLALKKNFFTPSSMSYPLHLDDFNKLLGANKVWLWDHNSAVRKLIWIRGYN